jgi:hypothetical protein
MWTAYRIRTTASGTSETFACRLCAVFWCFRIGKFLLDSHDKVIEIKQMKLTYLPVWLYDALEVLMSSRQ